MLSKLRNKSNDINTSEFVIPENFGTIAEKFIWNLISLNKQYLSYSFIR